MRNLRIAQTQLQLLNFVRSRYELIKPEPTLGLFNFRCFENAVEYARRYPDLEVCEVVLVDNGTPVLHYLNRDPSSGQYLETTLGWRAEHLEYYFIRRVHKDDYKHIGSEFDRALLGWLEQFTTWFDRQVLRIERIL